MKSPDKKATILTVIDFSEASMDSLRWAMTMAKHKNSHLTVLYPYRINAVQNRSTLPDFRRNTEIDSGKSFSTMVEPMLKSNGLSYDFQSEVGFVNDRINAHTNQVPLQMIVIGANMVLSNKDAMTELFETIQVPLVIVPQQKS